MFDEFNYGFAVHVLITDRRPGLSVEAIVSWVGGDRNQIYKAITDLCALGALKLRGDRLFPANYPTVAA